MIGKTEEALERGGVVMTTTASVTHIQNAHTYYIPFIAQKGKEISKGKGSWLESFGKG